MVTIMNVSINYPKTRSFAGIVICCVPEPPIRAVTVLSMAPGTVLQKYLVFPNAIHHAMDYLLI